MTTLNFLNPAALREADTERRNANGESAALDLIRKVHRAGPLAKGVSAARAKDPNADDAYDNEDDEDEDLDMELTDVERADLKARRKAKKAADKKRSNAAFALKMIKAIHGKGARPESPDALLKAASTRMRYVDNRASFTEIKKAQAHPMSMQKLFGQGNNNHAISEADIQRIIATGKRELRKSQGIPSAIWNRMSGPERIAAMGKGSPSLPSQSTNGAWGSTATANTGAASNDWHDENTQRPATERVGGFTDSAISATDSRIRAAINSVDGGDKATQVEAIKRDWARTKMKQAREFSNRPAARVSDGERS